MLLGTRKVLFDCIDLKNKPSTWPDFGEEETKPMRCIIRVIQHIETDTQINQRHVINLRFI